MEFSVLSTENSEPIRIPPASNDDFVRALLERGPPSPRTTLNTIEAHGSELSNETLLILAKAAAQAAITHAEDTTLRLKRFQQNSLRQITAQHTAITSADEGMRALQQRVEELEASLAKAEGRGLDEPECPTGFKENRGHVPDFYIKVDGVRLQARYVRCLPGTGMVEGTLGGPDDPVFLHELYVLPSIISETNPFPIPAWFIQSISANATAFPSVMAEAVKIGDWGLEAELERYHRVDTRLAHVQADIAELQAEADGLRTEKHACHY